MSATLDLTIDDRPLHLTSLDRPMWPALGVTKRTLLVWYAALAPALLPHLAGRALTLARFPEGVFGRGFYQTNCTGHPPWLRTAPVLSADGVLLRHCVVDELASLLWLVNRGVVELHPFLARVEHPRQPTTLVFDLDPGPPAGLGACARVALLVRDALARDGLDAWVKASGAAGLHLLVPLDGSQRFEDTRAYARRLAAALPEALVVRTMDRAQRAGRVYVDWGQNSARKSTIAAWSLRAGPLPQVSLPLRWDELAAAAEGAPLPSLSPESALRRLEREGDPLAAYLAAPGGRVPV